MGTDKAALIWDQNTTFLQAVARQMDFLQEKYLSVAAFTQGESELKSLSAGWTVLPDRAADCGPMGGIWTALTTCRAEWALVASCDIPAVERSLFYRLLEEAETGHCAIIYPVTPDGRAHLTCALYHKDIASVLEEQILTGGLRMRSLLSLCPCREIAVTDPAQVRMLTNINTM